ncbi:hypothetical protein FDECE_16275 [Fusarium decemcellulare]|nr:hypothetical protein FDECE_16275 [Fusarium decemcellulare]
MPRRPDVEGTRHGVFKGMLLQRLEVRGIPKRLAKWMDAFCRDRETTITMNGSTSISQELRQAGLQQGSLLSPFLLLYFNADLIQSRNSGEGSIAFANDDSARVTCPKAEANRDNIQAVIDRAQAWERRSGALFECCLSDSQTTGLNPERKEDHWIPNIECDKTLIVHFTRIAEHNSPTPITIEEERLEVHTDVVATKGLSVVMYPNGTEDAIPAYG